MGPSEVDAKRLGDEKRRVRRDLLATLATIDADRSLSSGRALRSLLLSWDGFEGTSEVVAYSALASEVDPIPICEKARAGGKAILLPRIVGEALEFAEIEPGEELIPGRYGILEPGPERVARRIASRAVILVPGVAFDSAGGRLGRGAGYYDRALSAVRAYSENTIFMGIGFPQQIVDRVPMSADDVRMDAILTEDALLWVGENRRRARR